MILTTTPTIEGRKIEAYLGLVTGDVIIGAHVFKDIMANIHDFFGGRVSSYEKTLDEAKQEAMLELQENAMKMGADAIVGIDMDYETVGPSGGMLMVSISGTAVRLER